MRILFIGNFEVTYSSEYHYLQTFLNLGHEITTAQENKTSFSEIIKKLDNIDLLYHVHTHGWHIQGLKNIYTICKIKGIPTVGYHLDLWKGIEREKDLLTDEYWNIEYFFTVDKLFVEDLARMGIKAYFLPAGVYEKECYLAKPDKEKYPHDIIFVGSRGYHHEWQYRGQLIEWLEKTYGDRFAQYGGGGLGTIRGDELNQLYASSKIVVGDTLCKGFNYPYYLSDRIFETTGRGGFIIHPYITGIDLLFNKKELVCYKFNDFDDLKSKIDYYLEHEKEREAIRLAGHNRTKKDHTYTQRLQYILDVVTKK
jgi:hypothetical protein